MAYRRSNSFQCFDRTDLVYQRISVHRRIDYHQSAYQIPTFNTTDWYTGESAYAGESITINRRIRFQRSTQQIGTPANRRTGVSDSHVQHNRLVHRRIGVPAYQIPTFNTTDWYTGESAYRRIRFQRSTQQIGTPANRRTGVSDSNVQHNRLVHRRIGVPAYRRTGDRRVAVSTSNVDVDEADRRILDFEALMATVLQPLAVNDHSRGRPSLLPTRRARRPLGPSNFQKCVSQLLNDFIYRRPHLRC